MLRCLYSLSRLHADFCRYNNAELPAQWLHMPSLSNISPVFTNPNRLACNALGDLEFELNAAVRGDFVADLAHLSVLTFTGEDAGDFLQGQLSCDIKQLRQYSSSTFGAYCTPKGRMLASFLLWQSSGIWQMVLSRSIAASVQKRLSMYVLRAKVRIVASQDVVLIGLGGAASAETLSRVAGIDRPAVHGVVANEILTAVGLPRNRSLLMLSAGKAADFWNAVSGSIQPTGTAAWEWSDIHSGIPWISAGTQDQFVPQMVNMELIGGVSFKKGCYPGQEIVARTQHLGKIKRRMYLAHVPVLAEAGNELHSDDVGGQSNGMVVNAVPAPQGGSDMLVVVQIESAANSRVHLKASDGPLLEFMPLPYPVR